MAPSWVKIFVVLGTFVQIALVAAKPGPDTKGKEKSAADWPIFRGNPLQTGVAGASLPDKLVIRWKFKAKDAIEGSAAMSELEQWSARQLAARK